jgi:transcriptional regulator with XRE-family HTH domain
MDFASKLRLMRALRGLSQRELSELAGVPEYTIPWIETGRMLPTPQYEAQIRTALEWDADTDAALELLAPKTDGPANGNNGNGQPATENCNA